MLVTVEEVAKMLGSRVDDLVRHLLPAAVQDGHEWRIGSCAGEVGRSMAIHRGGAKRGVWRDFSSNDQHGDALDLVAHCLFGGDKKKAFAWARSWLGIDGLDPGRIDKVRAQVRRQAIADEKKALEKAQQKQKIARAIWLNARPDIAGSPVDLYLLSRGIGIADLPRLPGALRYAPALEYPAHMLDGVKTSWPAMVAAITNAAGAHIATHRTYLQDKGGGLVVKAPVPDAKLTIGSYRGGFISVSRGTSGKPLKDAPDGDRVILCEGVEDALTLALCHPAYRVLAAISVGNIRNIALPPAISHVEIAADNDDPDSAAGRTLQAAIDHLIDQGRDVTVSSSPYGKDFNDMLQKETAMEMAARGQVHE